MRKHNSISVTNEFKKEIKRHMKPYESYNAYLQKVLPEYWRLEDGDEITAKAGDRGPITD